MAEETEKISDTINVNVESREKPKENRTEVPVNVYPYTAQISWFRKFGEHITISENRYAFFKAESTITIRFNHDLLDGKGLTPHYIKISIGWIRPRGLIPTFYRAASWSEHAYVVYESNECYKKWKKKPNCSEIKRIDDKLSKLSFASKYNINEHNSNPVEYEQTLAAYKRKFMPARKEANEIIERLIQEAPDVCRNEYQDSYTFYKFLQELGRVKLILNIIIQGYDTYMYMGGTNGGIQRTNTGKFKDAFDTKTRDERLRFCSKVFKDNNIVGRSKTDGTKDFNGNLFTLNANLQRKAEQNAEQKKQSDIQLETEKLRKIKEAEQATLNAIAAEEARDIAECKELLTQKGYSVSNPKGGRRTRRRSIRPRSRKSRDK